MRAVRVLRLAVGLVPCVALGYRAGGQIESFVITGFVAGAIIGSWWSLLLAPLTTLVAREAWYAFEDPPGARWSRDDTLATLIYIQVVFYGALALSAGLGSAVSIVLERTVARSFRAGRSTGS